MKYSTKSLLLTIVYIILILAGPGLTNPTGGFNWAGLAYLVICWGGFLICAESLKKSYRPTDPKMRPRLIRFIEENEELTSAHFATKRAATSRAILCLPLVIPIVILVVVGETGWAAASGVLLVGLLVKPVYRYFRVDRVVIKKLKVAVREWQKEDEGLKH